MALIGNVRSWARQQGTPVTIGLLCGLVGASIFFFLFHGRVFENIAFSLNWLSQPWTLITYPFAFPQLTGSFGLIGLIFTVIWLLWAGGTTEREIGSKKFGIVWLAMTILPALILWIGCVVLQKPMPVLGPFLPISGVTVVWCVRNQSEVIRFWGIIPIAGKWLGWLTVALVFVDYGNPVPLLGVLACLHMAAAYVFATNRIAFFPYSQPIYNPKPTKSERKRDEKYFDEVRRREQARAERERLRRLFEGSLDDENK